MLWGMFVLNVLEKPLEKILFKEVRKMAYKSKKEWYEKNKKNLRAREKTRAWKDYRNTRKKIDKYFENLDFKKKIYIIKAVKPHLFEELLENYNKHRLENNIKPKNLKFFINSGKELNLGGIC